MTKLNFYERAKRLGHSYNELSRGKEVVTTIKLNSLAEVKALIDDLNGVSCIPTPCNTSAKAQTEDSTGYDILLRVQDYIYNNVSLSERDMNIVKHAFPINILAVSLEDKEYDGREEIGNSSDIAIIYNYDTVTFKDKAYVNVTYTELLYYVDKILRYGSPLSGHGDFNILGKDGAVGVTCMNGITGSQGGAGNKGTCASWGVAGKDGKSGHAGANGTNAIRTPENRGKDGLGNKKATIHICSELKSDSGEFHIHSKSGDGGNGSTGSAGGRGGAGGAGGAGATCECTGSGGGNGGRGGNGGNGADGGDGGNGGIASEIIDVYLPSSYIHMIFPTLVLSDGGIGGKPGVGGAGGAGGVGGNHGKHNSDGALGGVGSRGQSGQYGKNGIKGRGAKIEVLGS